LSSSLSNKDNHKNPKSTSAWLAIIGLALVILAGFAVGAGRILVVVFPLGSIAVGLYLYLQKPVMYVSFVWWLWFVGPLIRRIIDYQSGFLTFGPWTLTPTLVTCISGLSIIRLLPKNAIGSTPFLLCIGSVFYAFLIGFLQNSKTVVINQFLGWSCPILFGFHLFLSWRDYPQYRKIIQKTFVWGTLFLGVYGVIQYLIAPGWDRFWLQSINNNTFGKPYPLQIRVSSSLNSPQGFGNIMIAGLLLLFNSGGKLFFPASGFGYLAILLSRARSAWIGWAIALMTYLISIKTRLQIRLVATMIGAAVLVVPLALVPPFSDIITSRLETLSAVSDPNADISYRARAQGYAELLNIALTQFLGRGFGYTITSNSIGSRDSSILAMLFNLGWLGSIPYILGLLMLLFKLFQVTQKREDPFVSVCFAISFAVFMQIGLNLINTNTIGMVLWGFIGIGMAGYKYNASQKILQRRNHQQSLS